MAARRRAPVVLATVLVFAVAGVTFASAPGTVIRMGVFNTITGNYATTLQGAVSTMVLQVRNNSTGSASAAIRAYAPYGGVPLDLRARSTQPVMRVSNSVKIAKLNADAVDGYSADPAAGANTIPVRDASTNTINANISGNAASATNADRVDGYDANSLARAARGLQASNIMLGGGSPTAAAIVSTTLTAPATGFVIVNGTANFERFAACSPCYIQILLRRDAGAETSTDYWVSVGASAGTDEAGSATWVFPVTAGAHTFDLRATNNDSANPVIAFRSGLSALYVPFGSTGGGTLGSRADSTPVRLEAGERPSAGSK